MSTKLQLWKGLDLSNYVCEYEVNRLTNEKVIRGKRKKRELFMKLDNTPPPGSPINKAKKHRI